MTIRVVRQEPADMPQIQKDNIRMSTTSGITYDDNFYDDLVNTAGPSASIIAPMVNDLVRPKSVVDIGCGDGSWLAAFLACEITDIEGRDGEWLDEGVLKFPLKNFRRTDLFAPISIERPFDLAISLEVAEHLPESRAAQFVEELTNAAPVVLFSAAIPLQEGPNHINEQWPSYWAAHFARKGYVPVDAIRTRVWSNPDVTWWYKQNMLIYVDETKMDAYPALKVARETLGGEALDLVHPDKYRALAKRAYPNFSRWLKSLPLVFRSRPKI